MTQQWKLVPTRATKAMQDAWDTAPFSDDTDVEFHGAYAAMLAAAPTPPASAQDDAKDERQPLFWYRPRSDDGYEGPLHNDRIEDVRKQSGAWVPLYPGFSKLPKPLYDLRYHGEFIRGWNECLREVSASVAAPAAGEAPEDLLHRLANPLTPYGLLARALRVATGTTLMDMARATGNTAAEISSIEFGRKEPDEGWFERAALFFASSSRGIVVPPSALKAAHKRRAASQQQEG
ncbi:helix-turn-helix domain-containing protein [Achromobacter xylosoxidans]|uniref:helix-turn-helix domain-containing protein n=1 Tax=Alcaligenes xylosoxydans xylosoxydans TaxID=85698 RepID=UPI000B48FA99|nr:helix-turn-helix transcriptional regulator [Achromobacter xylosoxidans]